MNNVISQRYKKALVTVAMGFRTEEDIKKNGLHRFTKEEKNELIEYVYSLYSKSKSVLALKIKPIGYRSEHININSNDDLKEFLKNLDDIYEDNNEIWIVSSSVIDCYRCRISISNNDLNCLFEMAYSHDDHILDHIGLESKVPYIRYQIIKNSFKIKNTNMKENQIQEANSIVQDILHKYVDKFKEIKKDLDFIGIDEISLDIRVNNGYDFHDFDVTYGNVEKVINYYLGNNIK